MSRSAHPRFSCARVPLVIAICGLALAGSACREEGTIHVKKITFDGTRQIDARQLKAALATKESSRFPWGPKKSFDRSRFDADLKRIQAFYADHGFPDARVTSVDVQMNDKKDAVSLTVHVSEGEPLLVDDVRFEGFDLLDARASNRLRASVSLKAGQPLNRQQFAATREVALNAFRDNGYPYVTVATEERPVPGAPHHVVAVYRATPGTRATFGTIDIAGNSSVGDEVIRRQLTFKPGDAYSRARLQQSQRRLYGLELFEFANVEPIREEGQPPEVPTRVTVAEGKHRRVNFGVGYGTEEKARVDAQWRNANFFGGARTFGIEARWSSLDRGVKADLTEPYFLKPHLSLTFSGQAWNAREPAYSSDTLGGRITLRHQSDPRARNMWALTFVDEYQRSTVSEEALADPSLRDELIALGLDPRDGKQAGSVIGFQLDVTRNTARNLLDARRGYYATLHLEQSGGWLPGAFDFYAVGVEVRQYTPVSQRIVVANRLQLGSLDGIGQTLTAESAGVPFSRRFFLGGSTSIRGWGRFEVSPITETGLPIGGLSMLEWSSELRMRTSGNLSFVAFLDAGNVWGRSWQFDLGDLRAAVGPGVRYQTPIGPIRADVGYQLTPIDGLVVNSEPEKRHWRIHFSIGQAF
jgi:outer membrane protein assembly complex protein YaeT